MEARDDSTDAILASGATIAMVPLGQHYHSGPVLVQGNTAIAR